MPTGVRSTALDYLLQNFVSYASGAVRLSALSGHQVIWVGMSNLLAAFVVP
jgi:transketolase